MRPSLGHLAFRWLAHTQIFCRVNRTPLTLDLPFKLFSKNRSRLSHYQSAAERVAIVRESEAARMQLILHTRLF